jgi:hypothetical protein
MDIFKLIGDISKIILNACELAPDKYVDKTYLHACVLRLK